MGHTFSNLLVHVIFGTKGRLPTIRESFRPRLYEYMSGIARAEFGRATVIGGRVATTGGKAAGKEKWS